MGCVIKYKGQSIPEEQFLQYLNKQIAINQLFESDSNLANEVYEALGFEIPTTKLQGKQFEYGEPRFFDVVEELTSGERASLPSSILINKLLKGEYLPEIKESQIILGLSEAGIWRPNIKKIEASGENKSTLAKKIGHELLHSVTNNIILSYQNLKGTVDFTDKYYKDFIKQGYIKPVDLSKSQIEALDNLVRIRNKVVSYVEQNKDKIQKQDRGFGTYDYFIRTNYTESETDLHEFISEVFTNPELINILKEIPTEGKKSNLFKDFVDAIAKILGFTNTSILEDIIAYSEEAFFQQTQITPQQKQQALQQYSQYLESLNKPNTNPILQGNQEAVITPNDKIIWGHPGIGKTFLRESGRTDVIDFDSDYKSRINEEFGLEKGFKARNAFQKSNKEEYQKAVRELWIEAKKEAKNKGKQLFASDMILLREFANDFDKVITMSKETFVSRAKQRNDYTPGAEGTEGWKQSLDTVISNVDKSKVVSTDKYLSDLFTNTQQEQVKKFAELQERLNNKEFLEGAKNAFESSEELQNVAFEVLGFKTKTSENEITRGIKEILPFKVIGNYSNIEEGLTGRRQYSTTIDENNYVFDISTYSYENEDGTFQSYYDIDFTVNGSEDIIGTGFFDKSEKAKQIIQAIISQNYGNDTIRINVEESKKGKQRLLLYKRLMNQLGYNPSDEMEYALFYDIKTDKVNLTPQQKQEALNAYTDYIARVSLGIIKNPSSGEYNYESQVKDIVYHGSPNKEIQSFLSPEKEGYQKQETTTTGVAGIYFSNKKEVADLYQDFKKEGIKGKTYSAVINTKRPLVVGDKATDGFTEGTFGVSALWNIQKGVLQGLRKAGIDAIKTGEYASKTSAVGENIEIAVFEPEQIHILGSKQDVEGFKNFVGQANTLNTEDKALPAPEFTFKNEDEALDAVQGLDFETGTFTKNEIPTGTVISINNNLFTVVNDSDKDIDFIPVKPHFFSTTDPLIPNINDFTNHSGGAVGADMMWDTIGKEFGFNSHKHYWANNKTPGGNVELTNEQLAEGVIHAKAAAKVLGRSWNNKFADLLGRNWYQVKNSTQIVAIAPLINPGEKNSKGYVSKASRTTVDGGTGYAVEMGIANRKEVVVFDTKTNQWFKWNGTTFEQTEIPTLHKNFAGIGSRQDNGVMTSASIQAIRNVYQKTKKAITTGIYNKVQNVNNSNPNAIKQSIINRINSFNTLEELTKAWDSPKFTEDQKSLYKEYFSKRKEILLAHMKRAEDFKNYVKENIGVFKTVNLGDKYTLFEAYITGNIIGGQIELKTNTGKTILVYRNQLIDQKTSSNPELENYAQANKNIYKNIILGENFNTFEAQITGNIKDGKIEVRTNTGKILNVRLDQIREKDSKTNKDLSRLNHRLSKFEFSDEIRVLYDQLREKYDYDMDKVHKDIISRSDVIFQPYFVNEENELVGVYYYESETNPTFSRFAKSLNDARASLLRDAMNNNIKLHIIQKYSPLAKYYPAKLVSFYYSLTEDQLKKIDSMLKKEGYEKIEDLFNNKISIISEDDIIEILKCHI